MQRSKVTREDTGVIISESILKNLKAINMRGLTFKKKCCNS